MKKNLGKKVGVLKGHWYIYRAEKNQRIKKLGTVKR